MMYPDLPIEAAAGPWDTAPGGTAAILLLGCDAAGGSLAAGIFRALGAGSPEGDDALAVTRLHDALLQTLGAPRNGLAAIPPADATVALRQPGPASALADVQRMLTEVSLPLIQDTAAAWFLPVWLQLLRESGRAPVAVLLVCEPGHEGCAGLGAQELGADLLWLRCMLEAEHGTRGLPRFLVPCEQLLEDWQRVCGRIGAGFGGRWPERDRGAETAVEQMVNHYRRRAAGHSALRCRGPAHAMVDRCGAALRLLADAANGVAAQQLDALRRELDAAVELFGPLCLAPPAAKSRHGGAGETLRAAPVHGPVPVLAGRAANPASAHGSEAIDRATLLRVFDPDWYRSQYPDVAAFGQDPLDHYREHGWLEGRDPCLLFDTGFYIGQLPEESRADSSIIGDPLSHYFAIGEAQGLDPHPLFDTADYRRQLRALGLTTAHLLAHYLEEGAARGLDPHPLFATDWYLAQLPERADGEQQPLGHYLEIGSYGDFSPHPLFDPGWYKRENPDVPDAGWAALAHFARRGGAEARSPHPLFDAAHYRKACPDAGALSSNLLLDYIARGASGPYNPHPLFDNRWYSERYPDAAASSLSPLEHYIRIGAPRGYDPGPRFESSWYLAQLPRLDQRLSNPLLHYVQAGALVGVSAKPSGAAVLLPIPANDRASQALPAIAVHAHMYHPDLAYELLFHLSNLPASFKLYVTTDRVEKRQAIESVLRRAALNAAVDYRVLPNRGRDLGPFFGELSHDIARYELVCHVHTKRSLHFSFGEAWRQYLLGSLLGSVDIVESIIALFTQRHDVGMLYPVTFPGVAGHHDWGANRDNTRALLERTGFDGDLVDRMPLRFPAGSMFWCRPEALRPLLDLGLTAADFPEEPLGEDGSILHAIERSLGYVAAAQGFITELVQAPQLHRGARSTSIELAG
jgi:hypothetical protein